MDIYWRGGENKVIDKILLLKQYKEGTYSRHFPYSTFQYWPKLVFSLTKTYGIIHKFSTQPKFQNRFFTNMSWVLYILYGALTVILILLDSCCTVEILKFFLSKHWILGFICKSKTAYRWVEILPKILSTFYKLSFSPLWYVEDT